MKDTKMKTKIREMVITDYDDVRTLWGETAGLGLSSADERGEVEKYLDANPRTSLIIEIDGEIVGSVLGGFDGRRGYIYHLTVVKKMRGKGLGKMLMDELELRFGELGAHKIHLMIYFDNENWRFYEKRGYARRDGELFIMSRDLG
jgi:N-acetylglutamate synthase